MLHIFATNLTCCVAILCCEFRVSLWNMSYFYHGECSSILKVEYFLVDSHSITKRTLEITHMRSEASTTK